MTQFFNPLKDELPPPAEKLASESSLVNEVVGQCPKCKNALGSATVVSGDSVYYCEKCRVSQPIPQ